MKLENIGSNMTAIHGGSSTVLFSYETPVASFGPLGGMRSETYMSGGGKSVTTEKHITKFFRQYSIEKKAVRVVKQSVIERKLEKIV